jgi:hypothetical protein
VKFLRGRPKISSPQEPSFPDHHSVSPTAKFSTQA